MPTQDRHGDLFGQPWALASLASMVHAAWGLEEGGSRWVEGWKASRQASL